MHALRTPHALFTLLALLLVAPSPAVASAPTKDQAMQQTRALIELLKQVKTAPAGKSLSDADRKANAPIYDKLDVFFAFDHLVAAPIKGREGEFKGDLHKRYDKAFRYLVRHITYQKTAEFFRKAELEVNLEKAAPRAVLISVDAEIAAEDIEVTVVFDWRTASGAVRVHDSEFDGVSLVADYRNQFAKIMKDHGAKGLVERMEKRAGEVRGGKVAGSKL